MNTVEIEYQALPDGEQYRFTIDDVRDGIKLEIDDSIRIYIMNLDSSPTIEIIDLDSDSSVSFSP